MNRTVRSLLAGAVLAGGLSACATYDPGYSYSEPYYGYDYRPYAYDYRPYANSYDYGYGYGYGYPYYGYYGNAPGYYVGPSFGLDLRFRDHDGGWDRGDHRSWRNNDHRGAWSGENRRGDASHAGRRNAGQARVAPATSTAPRAGRPAPVQRSTQARGGGRGPEVAPAAPNTQRAQPAPRATRSELRAEQRD